ncbi:DNA-binding transcriptional LysR family regulator [Dysgonomonas sp. PH5-45]|uniref:LysR substrate-binding domain-containing protein n=1 Tax=unclassified Dysgonomonas TaxID=2630389 RepID=UPI0024745E1C|nr:MULTISPECIES: LysR substrate-binding domain-containing protein [unclassified Dysgonomonas]MDH6356100.1 DNA-binding transcriptional LysR family regulator [Dysgonomonas sp. PH5-45]MDH6388997.1 DNA-binding transcriptional LysR family regulator [Dysgonomonas sp. PH5-37]
MNFRLVVFVSVARNLNFTRAAAELHISQPAISRHIQELESMYKTQLFERSGNKVKLTVPGETLLRYAENILETYRNLQLEMNLLTGNLSGELRVGASTTIAQYVLPPIIAKFISRFPDIRLTVTSGNTEQIEQALEEHKTDIGLVEGAHRKHSLKYTPFGKDELVLITGAGNKIGDEISVNELATLPLVLRESGSGTLEVIEQALAAHNKRLSQMNILLQLGSTESIKLFLENSPSVFAIVSITAITKELLNNTFKVVEVSDLELNREFSYVVSQGAHSEIQERFMRFLARML